MTHSRPHLTAVIREIRRDEEALPFLLGYLLSDLPDDKLCMALAAWKRHNVDLAEYRAEGLALVAPDVHDPRD